MYKVSLTGSYYSGQNDVVKLFENLGVKVFDADLILKYLINYSKPHIESIKLLFGSNIYRMGLLNLNSIKNNSDWNSVIDIVEYDILKSYEKFRLNNKEEFYTIFKYSYIFERNLSKQMDYTINCYRPKNLRKEDLLLCSFIDLESINRILSTELDSNKKYINSDFNIDNYLKGSDYQDIEHQVLSIHQKINKKKPQDSMENMGYQFSSGFWD